MYKKTLMVAEEALIEFMKKNFQEFNAYRGRIIKSTNITKPDQQMVSAAVKKINWYKVELHELEGELDMLREELAKTEDSDNVEGQDG